MVSRRRMRKIQEMRIPGDLLEAAIQSQLWLWWRHSEETDDTAYLSAQGRKLVVVESDIYQNFLLSQEYIKLCDSQSINRANEKPWRKYYINPPHVVGVDSLQLNETVIIRERCWWRNRNIFYYISIRRHSRHLISSHWIIVILHYKYI